MESPTRAYCPLEPDRRSLSGRHYLLRLTGSNLTLRLQPPTVRFANEAECVRWRTSGNLAGFPLPLGVSPTEAYRVLLSPTHDPSPAGTEKSWGPPDPSRRQLTRNYHDPTAGIADYRTREVACQEQQSR